MAGKGVLWLKGCSKGVSPNQAAITTGKTTSSFVGASATLLITDVWIKVDGPTKGNWIPSQGLLYHRRWEMDVKFNNWRLMALEPGALIEVEGVMAVENDRSRSYSRVSRSHPATSIFFL